MQYNWYTFIAVNNTTESSSDFQHHTSLAKRICYLIQTTVIKIYTAVTIIVPTTTTLW